MDRRDFLQSGAAALAAGALGSHSLAQATGRSATAPASSGPAKKLKVSAYSRHLQWLRTADEVAEATIEMAFQGVDITVRPYPGHVDPAKVATDLPPFVNTIRKHGLEVINITCPITDADSPNAESILQAASSLGIPYYWWGTFRYEANQPIMAQLEALKPRVEKLVKLNEKYKMRAMYHTYSIPATVGCNVWDLLYVLRNFDPKYVGFHWDIGHTSLAGGNGTWASSMRAAAPYIAGVSVKDYVYELNLETPEGGPFTGTPASLNGRSFGPPGPGGYPAFPPGAAPAGAPPPSAPAPSQPLPRSQAAEQAAAERGMAAQAPSAAGPLAGARAGQADQAPLAGPGGRPSPPAAPVGRGGGGQPNPWSSRSVPLGEGIDDLPLAAAILREANFNGPIEIHAEYPNGGADAGQDKITLPRAMVLGAMKRDLLALRAAFAASGLL